jgi:hypothetical protein
MTVTLLTFDVTVMKIVSSKKSTQIIMCYLVADTLALAKW